MSVRVDQVLEAARYGLVNMNESLYDAYHKGGPGVDCSCDGCEDYRLREAMIEQLDETIKHAHNLVEKYIPEENKP